MSQNSFTSTQPLLLCFYDFPSLSNLALKQALLTGNDRTKLEGANFPPSIISEIIADPTKIASMSLSAAQKSEALNAYGGSSLALLCFIHIIHLHPNELYAPLFLIGGAIH